MIIAGAFALCTIAAFAGVMLVQPADWTNPAPDFPRMLWTRAWIHWDASWYAGIVRDGYWYRPGEQSPVAFFPTYPSAVALLHTIGINRFVAGILVTALAGCGGLLVFNRWAKHLSDGKTALWATALVAVYPFSFYLFGAMYSDAVFFLLIASAFFAIEKEKLWLAVLLGALACAARPVAPAVVIGLLARHVELRLRSGARLRLRDFAPALAGLGLAAYMAFLWYRFGDPLAFVHVQSAPGWAQPVGWHTWLKLPLFELLAENPRKLGPWLSAAQGVIALGALALAVPTAKRLGVGYAIYVAVVLLIPLVASKDFQGLGRYALAAFPVFLTFALSLSERPKLRAAYLIASGAALVLLSAAFGADKYVA